MKITRHQQSWVLRFDNTLAQRTVLAFAGFSLAGQVRYINDYGKVYRQELINELDYYLRLIRRFWKRIN